MLAITHLHALSDLVHYLNFHEFHQAPHRNAQTHPLYVSAGSVQASYFNYIISSRFQPIRNIRSGQIDAHDALLVVNKLHGDHRPLVPLSAFQLHFDQAGITYIDRLARTVNTLNFLAQGGETQLHLNVHPLHLIAVQKDHGRVFEGILRQCGVETSRIVLEVQEHAIENRQFLHDAIQDWQSRGYRIALDNVGRHHCDIEKLLSLSPDILKLDQRLLNDVASGAIALAHIRDHLAQASAQGIKVIATGIETVDQLDLALQLGITRLQGFLLGKPTFTLEHDDARDS